MNITVEFVNQNDCKSKAVIVWYRLPNSNGLFQVFCKSIGEYPIENNALDFLGQVSSVSYHCDGCLSFPSLEDLKSLIATYFNSYEEDDNGNITSSTLTRVEIQTSSDYQKIEEVIEY
jgi:hypothetical protein